MEDYHRYCHAAAGLVGIGMSQLAGVCVWKGGGMGVRDQGWDEGWGQG